MKYDAVIFDLYGTLVDDLIFPASRRPRTWAAMAAIAEVLGVDSEAFRQQWSLTSIDRNTGALPTTEATFVHICREAGVTVTEAQIAEATRLRLEQTRLALTPRTGVLETLEALRRDGHKVGLLSNCGADVPVLWSETPIAPLLDAAVLSCETGTRKPDPRIFQLVCDSLRVSPSRCMFVGDGGSRELTGASEVGLDAVLIRAPYDVTVDEYREEWPGPRISSITQVLALVA